MTLPLTIAFWNYDRTTPIADGRVPIHGCTPTCTILRPQELFPRAFQHAEFDVSELSLSRQARAVAAGDNHYTALPIFPSRTFRHASIYVRTDRGIERPADLAGRRIGLNNYDDTTAVVVRGLLRDEYGLRPPDITWVIGDFDAPTRPEITPPALHRQIPVATLPPGRTLDAALAGGELDGIIGLTPPPCFGTAPVRRLFPEWAAEERAYFRRTGLFPIMHVIGLRSTLATAHPWLPAALTQAFEAAKTMALDDLATMQAPRATLPWVVDALERTRAVMGHDFWPYGLERNRAMLATTLRHLQEDGLIEAPLTPEALFK